MSLGRCLWVCVHFLTLSFIGCAPLSAPTPFHLMELAAPLQAGQVRLTAAGGGGASGLDGNGGGGALRLRVGMGMRQEIGGEGYVLVANTGKRYADSPAWIGTSFAIGYKLSWKYAPRDWVALLAGAGGSHTATGDSFGGDLGVVISRPRGRLRPYGGVRGTFAVPVGRPSDDAGGVTAGLVIPAGLALHLSSTIELFAEGGLVTLFATGLQRPANEVPPPSDATTNHLGGYGAAGLSVTLDSAR